MLSISEIIAYSIIKKDHTQNNDLRINKCLLEDSTHSDIHPALIQLWTGGRHPIRYDLCRSRQYINPSILNLTAFCIL